MHYLDFDLEIGPGTGRDYPVAVLHSPVGETRATMRFPFDELALRDHLKDLQIALLRSGGLHRRVLSLQEQTVQDFGRSLFDALMAGDVRSLYDGSRREAAQKGMGLRVRLRFQSPELAALPWEYLYDARTGAYLCLSKHTPLVRYLDLPQQIQTLTITPPLRVLGMIASPSDQDQLDIQREQSRLSEALKELVDDKLIELIWLEGQTWRHLQRALRRDGPWHVFHFIGHGDFDQRSQEGLLALADDVGKTHLLSATQAGHLLADHDSLRLVVLNACRGATGDSHDLFSSTAAILARRGIPAVLAMQEEITDRAAIELTRSFYEALADGLPVEAAVAEARTAITVGVNNSLEWGTPTLYLRSSDGVLFRLERQKALLPPRFPEPSVRIPPPPNEINAALEDIDPQTTVLGTEVIWVDLDQTYQQKKGTRSKDLLEFYIGKLVAKGNKNRNLAHRTATSAQDVKAYEEGAKLLYRYAEILQSALMTQNTKKMTEAVLAVWEDAEKYYHSAKEQNDKINQDAVMVILSEFNQTWKWARMGTNSGTRLKA